MLPEIPGTVMLHRRGSCVPTVIACLPQLKDEDVVIGVGEVWKSRSDA